MKKILFLVVTNFWYTEIAEGRKRVEYREDTPYWRKRLFYADGNPKEWDITRFQSGYSIMLPRLDFKFLFIKYITTPERLKCTIKTRYCYAIYFEDIKEK